MLLNEENVRRFFDIRNGAVSRAIIEDTSGLSCEAGWTLVHKVATEVNGIFYLNECVPPMGAKQTFRSALKRSPKMEEDASKLTWDDMFRSERR